MKKVLLIIGQLILLSIWSPLIGQTYNDGCGDITYTVLRTWNQEYEDPFFNDETNWIFGFIADADVDGDGLQSTGCIVQGGSWQIGWYNNSDITLPTFSYNGNTLPRYFRIYGHYEGDDWGGNCDGQTGFFIDDDDYRYDEIIRSNYDYRAAGPPNTDIIVQYATTWHGSSDYGLEFELRYTSPRPQVSANITKVCTDGSSSSVVLSMSGAIWGGEYYIERDGVFLTTVSGTTFTVPNQTVTRTYAVYTRNGGVNSLCSSSVTVTAENCSFNCVTRSYNTSTNVTCPGQLNIGSSSISFNSAGFAANSYIADTDVEIEWTAFDEDELNFWFYSENVSLNSTSLIDGAESGASDFTYSTYSNYSNMNTIFDEDAYTPSSPYTPIDNDRVNPPQFTGTYPSSGNVDFDKWELLSQSSTTDWYIRAGISPDCSSNLTVHSYGVTLCGCKSANYGTAYANGVASGLTICSDDNGTIALTHNGSTSNRGDTEGYGEELRWYTNSNGVNGYLGAGNPLIVPSPTTTTTYYCWYWVDGERCRATTSVGSIDENVTVTVDPETEGGDVVETGLSNNTKIICIGSSVNLTLQNEVGSVLNWESSPDGVSWANIANTSNNYTATPASPGQYFYRAQIRSGTQCDPEYSDAFEITVKPLPIAGTIYLSEDTLCIGGAVAASLNGHAGDGLQWQISTTSSSGPFTDIPGETSVNLATAETNTTTSSFTRYYRVEVSNSPCAGTVYTPTVSVTYDPAIVPGTVSSDQTLCHGENAAAVSLAGNNEPIIRWELDNNPAFSSPAVVNSSSSTLSGGDIDSEIGTSTNVQLFVRAITENACPEEGSDSIVVRYNQPDPIVMADASGTCEANFAGTWVHIYDPATDRLICSVNDNGQDLGDVTVEVFYHSGSAFTVPTTSPCAIVPQGVMNRNFVINSTKPINVANPVGIRLYFTDAELADLISVAGCGDSNGCADNDDVCGINDVVVTQIHGLPAIDEDGVFDPGAGTSLLHYPVNSGTGDNNFGGNYVQFNVTQFSEFWLHGTEQGYPLPVELLSFEAKSVDNKFVVLNWHTATEINNDGFVIERSKDGFNFERIGWVEGNGTSNVENHYSFQDNQVENGVYYYRLKQTDFDGAYEYSMIRSASVIGSDNNGVSFFIPNPAKNSSKLNVSLSSDAEISLKVYNEIGQVVENRREFFSEGVHDIELITEAYAAGIYSAELTINGKTYNRKLIIKN